MAILHQVALRADHPLAWESLRAACAAGDTVVLLDAAVPSASKLAPRTGVRICVPRAELPDTSTAPDTIELIDDDQWWQLIVDHELIQHWM